MQADDPPFLSVGTAVSAKYKGAFCEAKVSKVVHLVKCRVTFKMGLGNAVLTDDNIKGTLRVGQLVQAHHPDRKDLVDATITKIQDCSQYTVVFDDGDITTLRRTALCLKSGRHFNESETLDQLPLTHPEHFGNPVVGGRRGRRNRQPKDDSSDGEVEEENEPDLEVYLLDLKRVVSVEMTEKKRGSKDNWFPGLVVIPSAQPTVRINMKDEYLIRSFRDGRYYTVPKKEVSEFNKSMADKVENSYLAEAIERAVRFLDLNELPPYWEKSDLFNSQSIDSESDRITDSSDDEPCEEKDRFVAQLYKFMDDAGTPLNKTPTIVGRDIDLHRLFRVVQKLGGYNRVTNQNKWRMVTARLYLPNNQNTFNQVKAVYKKCLSSYETFYRTLGVTMLNHTRPTKKTKGRSLIRDKDRSTPINSPGPEKEDESAEEKKPPPSPAVAEPLKSKRIEKKRAQALAASAETSDTYSSDATDQSEAAKEIGRPKREKTAEVKVGKEKKVVGEKVKVLVEKFEEQAKKEDEEKGQLTRSKSQCKQKELPSVTEKEKKPEAKPPKEIKPTIAKPAKKSAPSASSSEEDKKKGKKRIGDVDSGSSDSSVCTNINIGDKLKVYYGPTHESKVTYEAKVIEIDKDQTGTVYLVHYTGWNTRYDEWIQPQRIAENLSATTKAKRTKQSAPVPGSGQTGKSNLPKIAGKRGRGASVSARSSTTDVPRSTTPSSVTSSGSRTKSPGTPATRSTGRLTRQDSFRRIRRISAQTDISNHSESDSDVSGSESEMSRTRSGAKSDETEIPVRTYQKRMPKPPILSKTDKRKDDEDTEKEEDQEKVTKRTRKIKRSSEKSGEESDEEEEEEEDDGEEDESNPPKGRDFDLNQIRSELKGFAKAIKLSPLETAMDKVEKEVVSSSDDSTNPPILEKPTEVDDPPEEEKKEKPLEKSSSSEDIYEFKEPEPFEFETRSKLGEEKKRLPRIFEEIDKSPSKRSVKMSPEKLETPDSPDRRIFRRATRLGDMASPTTSEVNFSTKLPVKKQDFSEEEDEEEEEETVTLLSPPKEEEDPFDKLVESPCFNIKPLEKPIENKEKVLRNLSEQTMSLFRELPETVEDYSGDMELSDCESQTEIFTTSPEKMAREGEMFTETFTKASPAHKVLDIDFPSAKTDAIKQKDSENNSDDEDMIREQIQRVIAQSSSTDEDSNDVLLIRPPTTSYQIKKKDCELIPTMATILGISMLDVPAVKEDIIKVEEPVIEVKEEPQPLPVEEKQPAPPVEKYLISPALQETDSSLLESIVSQPPVPLEVKLEETAKELSSIKTGTKIADSILQKLNSIKNEREAKESMEKSLNDEEEEKAEESVEERDKDKPDNMGESIIEKESAEIAEKPESAERQDSLPEVPEPSGSGAQEEEVEEEKVEEEEEDEIPSPPIEEPTTKKRSPSPEIEAIEHNKKRKKVLSRAFIDESDSDSSDSEQLVIARSDDDSQIDSIDVKVQTDPKGSDSSNLFNHGQTTDDSQSQEERNFNFDQVVEEKSREPTPPPAAKEKNEIKIEESEVVKEEESDPHLHSLLLCEEEIPRSPAPPTDNQNSQDVKPSKSVLEMPFASAPGTSNSKSMLLDQKAHQRVSPPHLDMPPEREAQKTEVRANSPPTTPESSISNLSPRGDIGGLSPTPADNESCKSNDIEPEFPRQRRGSSTKVSPYSEEDTQMTNESPAKRLKEFVAASCKRRRKSQRSSDDTMPSNMKKVKKPMNRSRQNSDSDDTSDHSNTGSAKINTYNRSNRSPRPSKYNFFVDFDPNLDSGQRISLLQQKISDLRKTYADVKAELAVVERRRKKIRRREREAIKAAKQQMVCA